MEIKLLLKKAKKRKRLDNLLVVLLIVSVFLAIVSGVYTLVTKQAETYKNTAIISLCFALVMLILHEIVYHYMTKGSLVNDFLANVKLYLENKKESCTRRFPSVKELDNWLVDYEKTLEGNSLLLKFFAQFQDAFNNKSIPSKSKEVKELMKDVIFIFPEGELSLYDLKNFRCLEIEKVNEDKRIAVLIQRLPKEEMNILLSDGVLSLVSPDVDKELRQILVTRIAADAKEVTGYV